MLPVPVVNAKKAALDRIRNPLSLPRDYIWISNVLV